MIPDSGIALSANMRDVEPFVPVGKFRNLLSLPECPTPLHGSSPNPPREGARIFRNNVRFWKFTKSASRCQAT